MISIIYYNSPPELSSLFLARRAYQMLGFYVDPPGPTDTQSSVYKNNFIELNVISGVAL